MAALTGCASEAPPLPPDTTSIDRTHDLTLDDFTPEARAMSCDQLVDERGKIADAMHKANSAADASRTRNQILVGFSSFGGLIFTPLLLAAENNTAEKNAINQLYERQDTLIKLGALKHCPAPPSVMG